MHSVLRVVLTKVEVWLFYWDTSGRHKGVRGHMHARLVYDLRCVLGREGSR